MATDKLRVKIEGDSRSYTKAIGKARKSTKGFQKDTVSANRTTKKQGQTFTQLSYALDDAQYGFRGVQNNLQQIAVQAGIGGPIVLGITAMLIGIQQLITHWDSFGDIASKSLGKVIEELSGSQGTVAKIILLADQMENAEEGTDEYKYALQKLTKEGFDPLNTSLERFIELRKEEALLEAFDKVTGEKASDLLGKVVEAEFNLLAAREKLAKLKDAPQAVAGASPLNPGQFGTRDAAFVAETQAQKAVEAAEKALKKYVKDVDALREKYLPKNLFKPDPDDDDDGSKALDALTKKQNKAYREAVKSIAHESKLKDINKESEADILKYQLEQLQALDEKVIGAENYKKVLDAIEIVEARIANPKVDKGKTPGEDGIRVATSLGIFDAAIADAEQAALEEAYAEGLLTTQQYYDALEALGIKFKTTAVADANEIGEALKSALTSAFIGLGQAIGDILTNEGDFGEKFLGLVGSFMQAFGAAIIGIGVAALTLNAALTSGQAWLAIGAGIALVAAGAVLSNISKKGVDGTGGGGTQSATTGTTTTPTTVNASFGGGLVATVRGQDLVFALEAAQSDRNALN